MLSPSYYGGAKWVSQSDFDGLSGVYTIVSIAPRIVTFAPEDPGMGVVLPDEENANVPLGGVIWYLLNKGTEDLEITAKGWSVTVEPGKMVKVMKTPGTDLPPVYMTIKRDVNGANSSVGNPAYVKTGRPKPAGLPVTCGAAIFILVRCDDPNRVFFTSDTRLVPFVGGVVKLGDHCYRVFTIRRSDQAPRPIPDPIGFDRCKDCYQYPGVTKFDIPDGDPDGDDSPYDPDSQILDDPFASTTSADLSFA